MCPQGPIFWKKKFKMRNAKARKIEISYLADVAVRMLSSLDEFSCRDGQFLQSFLHDWRSVDGRRGLFDRIVVGDR